MKRQLHTDWVEDARRIYAQIHAIASAGTIRIGFANSSTLPKAIAELKSFGLRKPMFANGRRWLQQQIITDEEAYVCLASNIKLEFIMNGSPAYWNGYGARIDYAALYDFAKKAGPWVLEKTSPTWVCIQFGLNYQPFIGLLDDLSEEGLEQ